MIFEDFLTLKGKDFKGRSLEDIWSFSDEEIENYHDFIQVVFPLNKASQAVFHGYYLDSTELVQQIRNNKEAANNIIKSSHWFISFLKRNMYGKKIVIGMGAGTISKWMRDLPKFVK